jgi:hypothetical protein
MNKVRQHLTSDILQALINKKCWHVAAGQVFSPAFKLVLGGKVKRSIPLTNTAIDAVYRKYEGETNLMVWCAWRLHQKRRIITSSEDGVDRSSARILKLVGSKVIEVKVDENAWDLVISFDDEHRLYLFCDRVEPRRENCELFLSDRVISAGPGTKIGSMSRLI